MNKPITLIRQELIQTLIQNVNNSELPAFIITGILENLLTITREQEKIQLEQDTKRYLDSLKEKKEEEEQ